jgi:hypothetical protein
MNKIETAMKYLDEYDYGGGGKSVQEALHLISQMEELFGIENATMNKDRESQLEEILNKSRADLDSSSTSTNVDIEDYKWLIKQSTQALKLGVLYSQADIDRGRLKREVANLKEKIERLSEWHPHPLDTMENYYANGQGYRGSAEMGEL